MNQHALLRARQGDPCAINDMVTVLRPRLTRMANYYARRCREDADDLVQEAWTGVFEALPALNPRIGDPIQHLLQYARWRVVDAVRRSLTHPMMLLDDDLHEFNTEEAFDADYLTELETAGFLTRLKSTQRAVLTCLLAGLTWREAGAVLACSSANIAYHVRQIKQQYEEWRGERIGVDAKNIPA